MTKLPLSVLLHNNDIKENILTFLSLSYSPTKEEENDLVSFSLVHFLSNSRAQLT